MWHHVDQVEGVVGVADDFRNAPGEEGEWQAEVGLGCFGRHENAADEHDTGRDLLGGDYGIARDETDRSVDHFEYGGILEYDKR